ncbi:MAG: energy-coupling factor ABC transporter permease [Zoogloeaceae bacterium]|nr:energy-coupling factor ABC transporter permease [Zoogloeaceae bacterium]
MNLPPDLFSPVWHLLAWFLTAAIAVWGWRTAPWGPLREGGRVQVTCAVAVILTPLWSMKAGIKPGLDLHLLGAMAAHLTLGPQLAMLSLGLALTGVTLNGGMEWGAWEINFILMVVVPVTIARAIHGLVERRLPNHVFVYLFVGAFLGGALTVMAQGLVVSLVLILADAYSYEYLSTHYLPYFLLLGFAEGWMTGMAMTLLVVYRPQWVATFDDQRYLLNK